MRLYSHLVSDHLPIKTRGCGERPLVRDEDAPAEVKPQLGGRVKVLQGELPWVVRLPRVHTADDLLGRARAQLHPPARRLRVLPWQRH